MGGWWLETDNRAISVQLNFTGTATGTELGNNGKIGNIWKLNCPVGTCMKLFALRNLVYETFSYFNECF